MSSGGRTKTARSKQKTGFDPSAVLTAAGTLEEGDVKLSGGKKAVFKAVSEIKTYEIPTDEKQRSIILRNLEETLLDLIPAMRWEYRKWWCFLFCTISALFGVGGSYIYRFYIVCICCCYDRVVV